MSESHTLGEPELLDDDGQQPAYTGFAPEARTDGRHVGSWNSRFIEKTARTQIAIEALYVFLILTLTPFLLIVIEFHIWPSSEVLSDAQWTTLTPFAFAYIGGIFGGTLFATKWLYHTVAKGTWNADRLLWRLFTPLLSGGVALTIILLAAGQVIPLFGAELVRTSSGALGVAIFVGYFSDKAFSRLERLADKHLGEKKEPAVE